MKKQMKAIDLHARKLGDEHLVPGAAALVRFLAFPLGPFLLGPLPGRRDGTTERVDSASPHQKNVEVSPQVLSQCARGSGPSDCAGRARGR